MEVKEQDDIKEKVLIALDEIRPFLKADGGDISLLEITDDLMVKVKLHGACRSCSMSSMTLKSGVEGAIRRIAPSISGVEAVDAQD